MVTNHFSVVLNFYYNPLTLEEVCESIDDRRLCEKIRKSFQKTDEIVVNVVNHLHSHDPYKFVESLCDEFKIIKKATWEDECLKFEVITDCNMSVETLKDKLYNAELENCEYEDFDSGWVVTTLDSEFEYGFIDYRIQEHIKVIPLDPVSDPEEISGSETNSSDESEESESEFSNSYEVVGSDDESLDSSSDSDSNEYEYYEVQLQLYVKKSYDSESYINIEDPKLYEIIKNSCKETEASFNLYKYLKYYKASKFAKPLIYNAKLETAMWKKSQDNVFLVFIFKTREEVQISLIRRLLENFPLESKLFDDEFELYTILTNDQNHEYGILDFRKPENINIKKM